MLRWDRHSAQREQKARHSARKWAYKRLFEHLQSATTPLIPFQNTLLDQIETIERELRIRVEILAIIPNLVQTSTMGREILAELRRDVPGVAPFELPKRVILGEAWRVGRSIFSYQPQGSDKRHEKESVMHMYDTLAE